MPKLEFCCDEKEAELLERVRLNQKLASIDQAAEWLIKARLRRAAMKLCGRKQTLYIVATQTSASTALIK